MELVVGLTLIAIIIIVLVINFQSTPDNLLELKKNYSQLLQGTDKKAALKAGRAYYSSLRKGKTLTMYDEQAIANDLSTMITVNAPHECQ